MARVLIRQYSLNRTWRNFESRRPKMSSHKNMNKPVTLIMTKAQLQKRGWIFTKSNSGMMYANCGNKEFSAKCLVTLKKRITETI